MRIVVTGASGFIGSHLARELRSAGHQVTEADIKIGSEFDLLEISTIDDLFIKTKPDAVVHLAGADQTVQDDALMIRDNVITSANLARVAKKRGVRVIAGSTTGVYGDTGTAPCEELKGPWLQPTSVYAASKLWSEQICRLHAPKGFTSLRFSAVYGPAPESDHEHSIVGNILRQARAGEEIPVQIGSSRSWCWIGDAVRGARLAIEKGEGPYNIGRADSSEKLEAVAEIACILVGADKGLIKMASNIPTQDQWISTIRIRQLGFAPTTSLWDGMEKILESLQTSEPLVAA